MSAHMLSWRRRIR